MSSLPLVNVTARINDQQGRPVAGAMVKMRLTTVEKYQGIVVPRETLQVTDAAGVAILRVFPNALGYEGSEYDVHITFPGSNSGVCGNTAPSSPVLRAIRAHAVVPNSDCNLLDILNLPPYEQRGAGAVLPEEVAGYASEAASHADAARSSAQAAEASKGAIIALKEAAEAAKGAAQASASQSAIQAQQSKQNADRADAVVCEFENIVNARVEDTATRLTAKATLCIKEQGAVSLNAIEQRSSDVLLDFTTAATEARAGAVAAIMGSKENALHAVDDAKHNALDDLKEVGAEYEEDFVALVERAEGAAKRAGCSSAGAANSAAKACACAEDAKTAAQGLERSRDEALDAARRADTAASCASADAQRAEAAADGVKANATSAAASAVAAHKNAQAAEASADLAKVNADSAEQSAAAADADKAEVEVIAGDVKKALVDTAATIVSEEIIDKATEQATAEANAARDTAVASKTAAESAKIDAEAANIDAESARDAAAASATDAKGHADRAKDIVDNLEVSIDDAVPKPIWEDTKLGFKNALGTVVVAPVELKGEKGDKGDTGDRGEKGDIGDTGTAATVAVGAVIALAAGSTPTVTNTGTQHAAVLDFAIPQGEKGDTPNVSIIAGTGLSGGGDLTADVTLDVTYGNSAGTACSGDDARLANARKPMAHTASHNHGGGDEIATITPAPNAIPKAGTDGKIPKGWLPDFVGGAVVVSTPVITLGASVPIGIPTEFTVTATPLLSGGRTIAHFLLTIPKLSIKERVVAAKNNAATSTFTVTSGTAIGIQWSVMVTAVDDMGNASAEAKKVVLTAAAFVKSPVMEAPVAGAKVNSTALIFATGPFGVTGTTDTHTASQYRLRAVADGATVYDSGEVVSLLTLTADVSDVVAEDVEYIAEARHKGKKLGWSAWGESGAFRILLPSVARPTIISPVADSTVYASVTVATSPFSAVGMPDTHESTDWYLTSDAAGTVIVAQALASLNKLSYTFTGFDFVDGQTLYAWAVHRGALLGKSAKSEGVGCVVKKGLIIAFLEAKNGGTGFVTTSFDGVTWTAKKGLPFTANSSVESLTYGAGKFMVIADGRVHQSTDGVTWTEVAGIYPTLMQVPAGLAYLNGKFIITGNNGVITSADGITWRSFPQSDDLPTMWYLRYPNVLAFGAGIYVGFSSYNRSYHSTNGESWYANAGFDGDVGPHYIGAVYGNGKFVASLDNKSIRISTSGNSWTSSQQVADAYGFSRGITYCAGRFVIGGYSKIYHSVDGISWTAITMGVSTLWGLNRKIHDKFMLGSNSCTIIMSDDGITWSTEQKLGDSSTIRVAGIAAIS